MSPPAAHSYNSADTLSLRQALGEYATGVAVVTARGSGEQGGQMVGLTVNSFASVSLDPPLVLWSLGLNSPSLAAFQSASHFAVNVLAANQTAISNQFAQPKTDKFAGIDYKVGAGGTALLPDCCAWFECRVETQYEGGDHVIFIGRVEQFRRATGDDARPPLLFHRGAYGELKEKP